MIWTFAQVALGGALGAVARFATVSAFIRLHPAAGPGGTLVVNVVGSFVMGLLFVWLAERGMMRHAPLLTAGILGGFTTFSAFSLDAWRLWEAGAAGLAATYVVASVVFSLLAVVAGIALMRMVLA